MQPPLQSAVHALWQIAVHAPWQSAVQNSKRRNAAVCGGSSSSKRVLRLRGDLRIPIQYIHTAFRSTANDSLGLYRTQKFAWDPFDTWPSYKVERIHHVMLVRGESRSHVQWQGIPESGMTWELARNLQDDHSRALLELFNVERATLESVRGPCFMNDWNDREPR